MKKILKELLDKRFSVYCGGEFESIRGFLGFIKLLVCWSDFFSWSEYEQKSFLTKLLKDGEARVDANISVKINK